MTKKTSPARVAAFLAALRATGNQTLAAERAKVSRSWVQLHRSSDPAFDAAVRGAVAEAKVKLGTGPHPGPLPQAGEGGGCRPPRAWGSQGGEELVVRGTGGARVQIARARLRQWTPRLEARFLRTLEATCNVKLACAAVGLTPASAYKHRERWPDFARRWDEAVAEGWERLDGALVAAAIALLDPEVEADAESPVGPMSVAGAIQLLGLHRKRAGLPKMERLTPLVPLRRWR